MSDFSRPGGDPPRSAPSDNSELTAYVAAGEILDDQAWRLIYWRHYQQREEGYPTMDDALGAAWAMEEWGTGSTLHGCIVRPDGSRIEGEEFQAARYAWERLHRR